MRRLLPSSDAEGDDSDAVDFVKIWFRFGREQLRIQYGFYGGINASVFFVTGVHCRYGCGVRCYAIYDAHDGIAGGVYSGPNFCADSGEDGGSIGCPFFGFHNFNFAAVNIGLNLAPEWRARASAAEANAIHGHVHFAKNCEGIAQTECDAFENRANDVSARVRSGKADESCARVWIEMRGAFAH